MHPGGIQAIYRHNASYLISMAELRQSVNMVYTEPIVAQLSATNSIIPSLHIVKMRVVMLLRHPAPYVLQSNSAGKQAPEVLAVLSIHGFPLNLLIIIQRLEPYWRKWGSAKHHLFGINQQYDLHTQNSLLPWRSERHRHGGAVKMINYIVYFTN